MSEVASVDESLAALRALMAALSQCRLYPAQHPTASRAVGVLAQHLERLLVHEDEWRLAVVGQRVIAGGQTVDERPDLIEPLIEDLKARDLDTIVFRRGLGVDDLRRFLTLMSVDARTHGGVPLGERLAAEGVRTIEAGRLVLGDQGERARESAACDQAGSDASEVYDDAVGFIEDTLQRVRAGRKINLQEAEAFVDSMIRQMQQDRSPYLILTTLKAHHAYTFTHIINVCILTLVQLEALGATPKSLRDFGLASMLHDIGKSLVPQEILSKSGGLTPQEFALIQRHPIDGVHILNDTPSVPELALVVAFEHHMRYNHAGYPHRKRPRALHPCSLMTNLADTYDAMRSRRSYQPEYPPERVATLISERSGIDFHPQLARAFLRIMGAYPPGTRVRLDSGEEALVVRVNPADPFRPSVRLLRDSGGALVRRLEVVDLTQREIVGGRFARSVTGSIASPATAEAKTQAAS